MLCLSIYFAFYLWSCMMVGFILFYKIYYCPLFMQHLSKYTVNHSPLIIPSNFVHLLTTDMNFLTH